MGSSCRTGETGDLITVTYPPNGPYVVVRAFGDSTGSLGCHIRAGDDVLRGDAGGDYQSGSNTLYGDAWELRGFAWGGNDTLSGASPGGNYLVGDAELMRCHSHGGNDTLVGGGASRGTGNTLFGDAREMRGHAQGGDDRLVGGDGSLLRTVNLMFGDAEVMRSGTRGGDDVLIAGPGAGNEMWGDARVKEAGACGGRDVFVMTGEWITIHDFEPGKDRMDVSGMGARSLADLGLHPATAELSLSALAAQGVGFGQVFVEHVASLSAADFIFA